MCLISPILISDTPCPTEATIKFLISFTSQPAQQLLAYHAEQICTQISSLITNMKKISYCTYAAVEPVFESIFELTWQVPLYVGLASLNVDKLLHVHAVMVSKVKVRIHM